MDTDELNVFSGLVFHYFSPKYPNTHTYSLWPQNTGFFLFTTSTILNIFLWVLGYATDEFVDWAKMQPTSFPVSPVSQ